ncbi:MAG: hypothetical protein GX580_14825 [Candidatus Hydrogenedens sp.]|nr:glycoside hydrolase family 99-like domain-containing protein [Candidatus Hydrogenedentota bacterium]NLF58901.1 hypothetical protein [Candidatus Hydrogenedens sp.]
MKPRQWLVTALLLAAVSASAEGVPAVRLLHFDSPAPLGRVGRPLALEAEIENAGDAPLEVALSLKLPEQIRVTAGEPPPIFSLEAGARREVQWTIEATDTFSGNLALAVTTDGEAREHPLWITFLPPMSREKLPYIPEPIPAKTEILIGAHHCPLWEADKPHMWKQLIKHPERTPALGFYDQNNPEVSDWETKWAVEHGVSFFIYCWYRTSQGGPVETMFSGAIHDAFFKSRFQDKVKFTIMWENQNRGKAGVADERDLMDNLLPFWLDNFFTHPSYLVVDNKPVLFIYRPEFLVDDLGGEEAVVAAFDKMRAACRDRGFDGLWLLGEYRGLDRNHLEKMKRLGLDYSFAYCWHVLDNPSPERAINTQMEYIEKTKELGILPQVVTVTQGWSGWQDEGSVWTIPPEPYKDLLRRAKAHIAAYPPEELGARMLLLDNWNEWGEGHYIAPYREHGFGYLDAVREVFSDAPPRANLLPEDIGMGPYDTAYREHRKEERELSALAGEHAVKPGTDPEGLMAWWSFDEEDGCPVVRDMSGNRTGGYLRNARRAPGVDGNALVCDGGAVEVPNHPSLSPGEAMTLACWVFTENPAQEDAWMVNRIRGGATHTGYRLGLCGGYPCFALPQTEWSHHLTSDTALPAGWWVHLAVTYDGRWIRLYMDGREAAHLERTGPVNDGGLPLTLGNFETGHRAHFTGLLDEVKLWHRALSPEEVVMQAQEF